jgi:hypothetical protein
MRLSTWALLGVALLGAGCANNSPYVPSGKPNVVVILLD